MTEHRPVVLVVTAAEDATADAVAAELRRRDVPTARFDTGDFPTRLRLAARLVGDRWSGSIGGEGLPTIDLDSVRAVYYRRPTRFVMPEGLSDADAAFATREARLGFGGVLLSLPGLWVNHPTRIAEAEYKAHQLVSATEVGLRVPKTTIVNEIDELRAFAADVGGPVICKAFSSMLVSDGDVPMSVFSTMIDPAFVQTDQFAVTAHLVQEWIPKICDARVTVVDGTIFAVAIHAQSPTGMRDWRADYQSLRYERIDPPEEVVKGIQQYLSNFGLYFGAFDFVVEPDGGWRFLECNPNGQWLWLEHEVELPIAAAMDTLLSEGVASC